MDLLAYMEACTQSNNVVKPTFAAPELFSSKLFLQFHQVLCLDICFKFGVSKRGVRFCSFPAKAVTITDLEAMNPFLGGLWVNKLFS